MSAFRATFSDMKLVKTRQVAQLIFEIPMEEFDAAYEVLGGLPNPSMERWFGIAAINHQPAKEVMPNPQQPKRQLDTPPQPEPHSAGAKRQWKDMQPQQQAGIRSSEATFVAFLKETRADDWHESQDAAECVRLICGVHSRVELGTNQRARILWHQLDEAYQAWKAVEHA